jgi:hypothetical protein
MPAAVLRDAILEGHLLRGNLAFTREHIRCNTASVGETAIA